MEVTSASQTVATTEKVEVRAEDLIDGCRLHFPITDSAGRLLLAENSVVTPRFRDLLKARNVQTVMLDPEDAAKTTVVGSVDSLNTSEFDETLKDKLAEIAHGSSVKNSMVFHGCLPYDPVARKRLTEKHQKSVSVIDGLLSQAVNGIGGDAEAITDITAGNLNDLALDCENSLSAAIALKDDKDLSQHCLQMSLLGMAMGVEMDLDAESVRLIGVCGLIHDWGMARVSEDIRNANRRLTRTEYIEVQKHCVYTQEMLEKIEGLPILVQKVSYQVHERPNGQGYPRGRTLEHIHPFARILNVADCYAAMTSPRPYRDPVMPYHAMECLLRQSKDSFVDPDAVRALLRALSLFPIGSLVLLNDGSIAQVIRRNPTSYTAPIVQRIQNIDGTRYSPDDPNSLVNLAESEVKVAKAIPNPRRNEIALEGEELEFQSMR